MVDYLVSCKRNAKCHAFIDYKDTKDMVGFANEETALQAWNTRIAESQVGLSEYKMREATIDLVDQFFPKGECKERGQAIVLYATILIALKAKESEIIVKVV